MENNINNLEEKVLETQAGLVDEVETNIDEENNNEQPKKNHHFSALYAARQRRLNLQRGECYPHRQFRGYC